MLATPQDTDLDEQEIEEIDASLISEAVSQARKDLGCTTRTGGYLPYFLVYDLLAAGFLAWRHIVNITSNSFSPDDPSTAWKFWTTIFFAKLEYALLSFPFLIFALPVLGPALMKTKATGYDMRGMLCAKLNLGQIKQIYRVRKEKLSVAEQAKEATSREAAEEPLKEKSAGENQTRKRFRWPRFGQAVD